MSEETNVYQDESARLITCPKCGSPNWICYNESTHWFRDEETGDEFQFPVGDLKCGDCNHAYAHCDLWDNDPTNRFSQITF